MTIRSIIRASAVAMAIIIACLTIEATENGKIAFTSERDGNSEIYVMNADGSDQTRLTHNTGGDMEAAFSPDGTKIAFTSFRDGNYELFIMDSDGSNLRRLTFDSSNVGAAAWNPDGTRLVYIAEDGYELRVVNSDGSGRSTIYTANAANYEYLDAPDWSPNGAKIAFELYRDYGFQSDIIVMNSDGTGVEVLLSSLGFEYFSGPAWSANGARIVVSHNIIDIFGGAGVRNLEIVNLADGTRQVIYTHESFNPDWSPDATGIVFDDESWVSTSSDIRVITLQEGTVVNLTNSAAMDYDPSWGRAPAPVVSVSGKVRTPDGRGLRNAIISITDSQNVTRTLQTSSLGFYTFDNVQVGGTYTIRVMSKRYRFASRSIAINNSITDLDFVGEE